MKRVWISIVLAAIVAIAAGALLVGCGAEKSEDDYKSMREISWEGTELTVVVGANKSTGCEWKTKFEDDSIITYSLNRKFTLASPNALRSQAIGTSAIGFEGKSAGTTKIYLSTPKDWDGNEPGYTYTVTVEVNDDGTIANATGE